MKETRTQVPSAPGKLPLIGHALPLFRDPLGFLESLPHYGDLVQVNLAGFRAVVVCDPELTHEVLVHDRIYDKGGLLHNRLQEIMGPGGVATCPHGEHRRMRRLIQPVFHKERFTEYTRTMAQEIASQVEQWKDGEEIDVLAAALSITSRVTVLTMFSAPLPRPVIDQIVEDLNTALSFVYKRLLIPERLQHLPVLGKRSFNRALTGLREVSDRIIIEYRKRGMDHGDLLSKLLSAQGQNSDTEEEEKRGLSAAEVSDHIVTFLLGGIEANANTIAWALHLIARRPKIQKLLHSEIDSVLAGAPPEFSDIPKLDLTSRVVCETLRLYPIGWFFTRATTEPVDLGGYRIPAGTTVVYSAYILQRREDLYRDPEQFDPDRWTGDAAATTQSKSFLVFGGGARQCVGDKFGLVQATLTLATVMSKWQVEPATSTPLRPKISAQLSPNGGPLRIRARRPISASQTPSGTHSTRRET